LKEKTLKQSFCFANVSLCYCFIYFLLFNLPFKTNNLIVVLLQRIFKVIAKELANLYFLYPIKRQQKVNRYFSSVKKQMPVILCFICFLFVLLYSNKVTATEKYVPGQQATLMSCSNFNLEKQCAAFIIQPSFSYLAISVQHTNIDDVVIHKTSSFRPCILLLGAAFSNHAIAINGYLKQIFPSHNFW
jgi:hypothetical protein